MIPQAFIDQMREILGSETDAFLACLDENTRRGLRLNPRRENAASAAADYLAAPVPWCNAGWYVPDGCAPGKDILHTAGAYYMQEPSAMAPAEVLCPRPGEWVLDLCAAPGGKSGRIADYLNGEGLLAANEIEPSRAKILSSNLERLGVTNAMITSASPDKLARQWPETFDAILTDAPCSGEGMFRRVPEAQNEWEPGSPAGCAQRQAHILDSAARMLAPGGRLVYSTCTFNRQENEETILAFLARHPEFSPEDFSLPGIGSSENGCLRLWPHKLEGEGHFVALLRKAGTPGLRRLPAVKTDKAASAAFSMLCDAALREIPAWLARAQLIMERDVLVAKPMHPDGPCLRCGVALCKVGKNYVIPEHTLAMALRPTEARNVLSLTEEQARILLTGQTLPCENDGWTLAVYKNMPLCWGKAVGGVWKNHLPKGLRI